MRIASDTAPPGQSDDLLKDKDFSFGSAGSRMILSALLFCNLSNAYSPNVILFGGRSRPVILIFPIGPM